MCKGLTRFLWLDIATNKLELTPHVFRCQNSLPNCWAKVSEHAVTWGVDRHTTCLGLPQCFWLLFCEPNSMYVRSPAVFACGAYSLYSQGYLRRSVRYLHRHPTWQPGWLTLFFLTANMLLGSDLLFFSLPTVVPAVSLHKLRMTRNRKHILLLTSTCWTFKIGHILPTKLS